MLYMLEPEHVDPKFFDLIVRKSIRPLMTVSTENSEAINRVVVAANRVQLKILASPLEIQVVIDRVENASVSGLSLNGASALREKYETVRNDGGAGEGRRVELVTQPMLRSFGEIHRPAVHCGPVVTMLLPFYARFYRDETVHEKMKVAVHIIPVANKTAPKREGKGDGRKKTPGKGMNGSAKGRKRK